MLENHHNKVVGSNPSTNTTKIHIFIKNKFTQKIFESLVTSGLDVPKCFNYNFL